MKKADIERILKHGSVRQKIKLYMTDIALLNVDLNNLEITVTDSGELNIKGSSLLTNSERDMLWDSIKERKDIEYYNRLRTMNGAFVLFKEKLEILNLKQMVKYFFLGGTYREYLANKGSFEVMNDMLEIYTDKKSRATALKKALAECKNDGAKMYQENGSSYIRIDVNIYFDFVAKYMNGINETSKDAKDYIVMFKTILTKELPLQPYKDWLKVQESKLIETINDIYEITSGIEGYSSSNNPQLLRYEDIEVDITQEDIEDFKSAGV